MFETMITGEGMVIKGCHSNFNNAVDQLANHINEPVSGHVVDGTTGEVLIQLTDGSVSYIATAAQIPLMEYAEEADPVLAMLLGLLFLATEMPADPLPSDEPPAILLELFS